MRAPPLTRRGFLEGVLGSATLLGERPPSAHAEPSPETTTLRLIRVPAICLAPQYVANEILASEGFAEVQYVNVDPRRLNTAVGSGEADLSMVDIPALLVDLGAAHLPIVALMGVHAGCYELFGTDRVKSIRDLKGKTVSVPRVGGGRQAFVASMARYVGLEPNTDINWVANPRAEAIRLLADGKIDAYLGFPPEPEELREKKVGHVVIDTGVDRPWSQYFCCIVIGNKEFVSKNPMATKRALRALLKANAVCAFEPERVARFLVERQFTERYDYAVRTLRAIPYSRWREYSAEDSVRFYALRFQEAGFIKGSPQKILAQHTDWRFLNELKRELKG